ncbi:hypothetical protein M5K25_025813 [Dendrobium thyrsiflorum]|uniref:Uncharacterized protein n=1 Tax=Dendrobium thyrsiflorum TaxID=117978 RepID=A0ABD0U4Y6_DENTH
MKPRKKKTIVLLDEEDGWNNSHRSDGEDYRAIIYHNNSLDGPALLLKKVDLAVENLDTLNFEKEDLCSKCWGFLYNLEVGQLLSSFRCFSLHRILIANLNLIFTMMKSSLKQLFGFAWINQGSYVKFKLFYNETQKACIICQTQNRLACFQIAIFNAILLTTFSKNWIFLAKALHPELQPCYNKTKFGFSEYKQNLLKIRL